MIDAWAPVGSVWSSVNDMPDMVIAVISHPHPLGCVILFLHHEKPNVAGTTRSVYRAFVTQNFTRVC